MTAITMYGASVPGYLQQLKALVGMLDKAEAHATAKKIDPNAFLQARLFPDMFTFVRQVQLTTDFAKGATARLAGVDLPSYPDIETTFPELKARIEKTIAFIETLKPEQFAGAETRDITIKIAGNPVTFKGEAYLVNFAIPNFYFHLTTVYALLRSNGVELGKGDFVAGVRQLAR
jgi:uncharacterized protein